MQTKQIVVTVALHLINVSQKVVVGHLLIPILQIIPGVLIQALGQHHHHQLIVQLLMM